MRRISIGKERTGERTPDNCNGKCLSQTSTPAGFLKGEEKIMESWEWYTTGTRMAAPAGHNGCLLYGYHKCRPCNSFWCDASHI